MSEAMSQAVNWPGINDAKKIAYACRKLGVIIIAVDSDGQFGMASYGMTRALCDEMKRVSIQIGEMVSDGTIEARV